MYQENSDSAVQIDVSGIYFHLLVLCLSPLYGTLSLVYLLLMCLRHYSMCI